MTRSGLATDAVVVVPIEPMRVGRQNREVPERNLAAVEVGRSGGDADRRVRQIAGRRGNDRIKGRAGADCIRGQRGNDRLQGNTGADLVVGGPGADVIRGLKGRDKLVDRSRRRD